MAIELNQQQQKVLDHGSGPMLVVAGAGTGKTATVIEKISQMLAGDVRPESILALTFTEKAAREMLDRLLERVGKVNLDIPMMTFNGFGESILREFASHIGYGRSFRVLSEQAQIVFIRERIDEFGLDYFLPLASLPDAVIKDLTDLFSKAKQSLISPKMYLQAAEALPSDDEAKQAEKRQQLELARAYSAYTRLCAQENVIDYDDQIYLLVQLLLARPNIKARLQARFSTIFVDEFQDTNYMQSVLVDLLTNDAKNIIVVGDDDQSIYSFRGADLGNILSFKQRYPKADEAALTINYRSGQQILDSAYKLIKNNNPYRLEHELKIDKRLRSDSAGNAPQLKHFDKLDYEIDWLASDIAQKISAGQSPGSIAVLARRRYTARQVSVALSHHKVPHKLVGFTDDMYAAPAVRMLTELARTIAEPNNNNSLHHTLTSPLFNIPNILLADMAEAARYAHEPLADQLALSTEAAVVNALGLIKNWREQAATKSVGQLLFSAIEATGYKDSIFQKADKDADDAETILSLGQFFASLKSFEAIASQPTIYEYMLSLPALKAAGQKLDDTLDISEDEVNVMTIHKAKGLEWDSVYLPNLVEGSFPLKKQGTGLTLPESLISDKYSEAKDHYREERRLMYVAMTRAKKDLVLSYSDAQGSSKSLRKPSRFIEEIFDEMPAAATGTNNANIDSGQPKDTKLVEVPNSILNNGAVRLSVSQAAALLNCPLDFYYKFVLRAPEKPEPQTSYGTSLHGLIEQMNRSLLPESEPVTLKQLITELKQNWLKAGYASREQERRAFATAEQTLTRLYNELPTKRTPTMIEEPFEISLKPEGIALRGRFDIAYQDDQGSEVRDYKSGTKIDSAEKAKKRAQSSIQLSMYALAWQQMYGELPDKLSLEFIDTGYEGSVRKTSKGIESLRAKLNEAANQIRSGEFPLGSSQHDHCLHP